MPFGLLNCVPGSSLSVAAEVSCYTWRTLTRPSTFWHPLPWLWRLWTRLHLFSHLKDHYLSHHWCPGNWIKLDCCLEKNTSSSSNSFVLLIGTRCAIFLMLCRDTVSMGGVSVCFKLHLPPAVVYALINPEYAVTKNTSWHLEWRRRGFFFFSFSHFMVVTFLFFRRQSVSVTIFNSSASLAATFCLQGLT